MYVKFVQQRLAEVHHGHREPGLCMRDGLEPAAGPNIDRNPVVTGRDGMGGKEFLGYLDLLFPLPA